MLLGTLIFLGAVGISALRAGAENSRSMSKPMRKTEKGYDVYMDRLGREYVNGRPVYFDTVIDQYGNWNTVLRDKQGNIYSNSADVEALKHKKYDDMDYARAKKIALRFKGENEWNDGEVHSYFKYQPSIGLSVKTEASTGRPYKTAKIDVYETDENGRSVETGKVKYYKAYYNKGNPCCLTEDAFYDITEITELEYRQLSPGLTDDITLTLLVDDMQYM